jgi:hypothetical protein
MMMTMMMTMMMKMTTTNSRLKTMKTKSKVLVRKIDLPKADEPFFAEDHHIGEKSPKPKYFKLHWRKRKKQMEMQARRQQEQQEQQQEPAAVEEPGLPPLTMDELRTAPGAFEMLCHGCGFRHHTPHRHVTRNMIRLFANYPDIPFPPLTQLYLCCLWFKRDHPVRVSNLKDWLAPIPPPHQRPMLGQLAGRPRKRKRNVNGTYMPYEDIGSAAAATPKAATAAIAPRTPTPPPAVQQPQKTQSPQSPQSLVDVVRDRHRIHNNIRIVLANLRSSLSSVQGIVDSALVQSGACHHSH